MEKERTSPWLILFRVIFTAALIACIEERAARGERPPWGSPLGGEIYVHGGGLAGDWTAGCVALADADAERLYALAPLGTEILILP